MFLIVHEAYSRQQILAICCSRLVYRGKLCFARSRGPRRTESTPAHPVPLVLAHAIAEMPHAGQLRWTGLASTIAPRCRVIPCIHSLTSFFFFFSHKNICAFAYFCILLKSRPPTSVWSQICRFLLNKAESGAADRSERQEDTSMKRELRQCRRLLHMHWGIVIFKVTCR